MRKGLQLTLLTVALALISVQAMALAPVIQNIPSPIVGNAEPVTDGGKFVFLDAMDLNALAIDDATPQNQLMWTFTESATPGSKGYYLINGIGPINVATANITSPTASQIINRTVKSPEYNPDGQPNTITIRNQYLSPLGTGTTVDEGWDMGLIMEQSQVVTFFCSDGTSYSQKSLLFYSTNNDYDKLSGALWTQTKSEAPKPNGTWKPEGWTAGVTSSTWSSTGSGLCIIAPLAGANVAEFVSPAPYFNLTKNSVYRIKMQMNSTQGTVGKTPLWDLVIENTNATGTFGMMAYMMDTMFYDDPFNGGSNTVVNTSQGDWKSIYWTPAGVLTPQWDKIFTSAYDNVNDPRLRFRILDVDGVGMGQTKFGAICIQNIVVDSVPISRTRVVKNVIKIANGGVVQANAGGTGNVEVQSLTGAPQKLQVTYSGGAVTVKPTATVVPASYNNGNGLVSSTGQQFEFAEVHAATTADNFADSLDNWPISWEANVIYRLQVGLSAPSALDAAHPWDAIFMGFHSRTFELFADGFITSRDLLGSPAYIVGSDGKVTPQLYTMFFSSGKGSKAASSNARLNWIVRFANTPAVSFPSNSATTDPINTGAVTVHSVQVDTVDFSF